MSTNLPALTSDQMLPPILAGTFTPDTKRRVEQFYLSISEVFEAWVTRRQSPHTQRAYREDFMAFVKFMGIKWQDQAWQILKASIKDVQAFRDQLIAKDAAPKSLNRSISSVSSFYKYLGAAAAELRLPITVPNPAHAQFIARESTDPRDETKALSSTRARQLMGMPAGDTVLNYRDRAETCVYTPHSLRAKTATLLLDADVDIRKVQDLLGHRHITTTQIYDKRRRSTAESASHDVPI